MSTVKSKNLQVGTDATASNNFTIYHPSTPDGTLRMGVGNADSPTEVGRFTSAGYKPATAPAFSAKQSGTTSCSHTVNTKLLYATEEFDTNNNYDTSNSRFTPTVAGYYFIKAINMFQSSSGHSNISIYKNGSQYTFGDQKVNNGVGIMFTVSELIYCNGTTDYIEIYTTQYSGSTINNLPLTGTYFSGFLVQQA